MGNPKREALSQPWPPGSRKVSCRRRLLNSATYLTFHNQPSIGRKDHGCQGRPVSQLPDGKLELGLGDQGLQRRLSPDRGGSPGEEACSSEMLCESGAPTAPAGPAGGRRAEAFL